MGLQVKRHCEAERQCACVAHIEGKIFGGECAERLVGNAGFGKFSVVDILYAEQHVVVFAKRASVYHRCQIDVRNVVHVVESHHIVRAAAHQCWVLERQIQVAIVYRHIYTAKSRQPCRCRQIEKLVGVAPRLGKRRQCANATESKYVQTVFHLLF